MAHLFDIANTDCSLYFQRIFELWRFTLGLYFQSIELRGAKGLFFGKLVSTGTFFAFFFRLAKHVHCADINNLVLFWQLDDFKRLCFAGKTQLDLTIKVEAGPIGSAAKVGLRCAKLEGIG
jgi:hypothetical protein